MKGGGDDGRKERRTLNSESSTEEWRDHGRLWSRLPAYRRLLRRTKDRILRFIEEFPQHAVCFSYGKDSCVVLHLVRSLSPDTKAVYVAQGSETPDTDAWREEFPQEQYGGPISNLQADLSYEDAAVQYGWWGCPITGPDIEQKEWKEKTIEAPLRRWYKEHGIEGAFVGIRGQESRDRATLARSVYKHQGIDYRTKPPRCYPLVDWKTKDVWAYIAVNELPYNPTYDRECLGFDRYNIRVAASLAPGGHLSHGVVAWLRYCYPEWFRKMKERFPNWATLGG